MASSKFKVLKSRTLDSTNLENLTSVIDGLRHISAVTMKLRVAHRVHFFHNLFVGKSVEPDHVAHVFHELINGDAPRVLRVGDAELCVEGVDGAFCKFCSIGYLAS